MLLGVLGYGKNGEYVGDDWSINVLVDAQNLGILNLGVNYLEAATREQVAQYAFNAITGAKCHFVAFNKSKDAYEPLEDSLQERLGLDRSEFVVINGKTTSCVRTASPSPAKSGPSPRRKSSAPATWATLERLSSRTSSSSSPPLTRPLHTT